VFLASLPLALLAAALQVAVAMNARSFKEAQSLVSILMIVPILPGLVVSMMELKTGTWMYLVPSLANQTLLREVAKGGAVDALPFVLTFASSALPAVLAALFASWRMKSERYVLAV
jgi:sodium transport system permease protein